MVAAWDHEGLVPLSPMELEHLQTRAAVPYRDRSLTDDAVTIMARRDAEQRVSSLESSKGWRDRWHID